jgi:hypothetical protein
VNKYNESEYKIYLDCVSIVFIAHVWNVLWVVNVSNENCMMKTIQIRKQTENTTSFENKKSLLIFTIFYGTM